MPEPVISRIQFASAPRFLDALRRSNPRWEGSTEIDTGWIFRGQSNAEWPLTPRAFRAVEEAPTMLLGRYLRSIAHDFDGQDWLEWIQPEVDAPPDLTSETWHAKVRGTALRALTHMALVRDFVLLADAAGHRVRTPPFLWHVGNNKTAFLNRVFHGAPDSIDPVIAIAQHHGVPTGLLDWTYNPLVAAYFAAERPSGARIAVWATRTKMLVPDRYVRRLTVPPQENPFLDAQEGLFTWCPQAYLLHLNRGQFPTFEELVELTAGEIGPGQLPRPVLLKLTLPASEASRLLRLLWREKMSPAHLMPTFDNVTRALEIKSTWLSDRIGAINGRDTA